MKSSEPKVIGYVEFELSGGFEIYEGDEWALTATEQELADAYRTEAMACVDAEYWVAGS